MATRSGQNAAVASAEQLDSGQGGSRLFGNEAAHGPAGRCLKSVHCSLQYQASGGPGRVCTCLAVIPSGALKRCVNSRDRKAGFGNSQTVAEPCRGASRGHPHAIRRVMPKQSAGLRAICRLMQGQDHLQARVQRLQGQKSESL